MKIIHNCSLYLLLLLKIQNNTTRTQECLFKRGRHGEAMPEEAYRIKTYHSKISARTTRRKSHWKYWQLKLAQETWSERKVERSFGGKKTLKQNISVRKILSQNCLLLALSYLLFTENATILFDLVFCSVNL